MRRCVLAGLAALALLAPSALAQTPPAEVVAVERPPEKTGGADPVYPDSLRRAGVEGSVVVRAWITKAGTVKDVQVLRSDHEGFNAAAVAAVRTWTFSPALQRGQPVDVWLTVPIRFRTAPEDAAAPDLLTTLRTHLRPEQVCGRLPRARLVPQGDSLALEGVDDLRLRLLYSYCLTSGDRRAVETAPVADVPARQGMAALERLTTRAMAALVTPSADACAALPAGRLAFRDGAFRLDGAPPEAAHWLPFACTFQNVAPVLTLDPGTPPPPTPVLAAAVQAFAAQAFARYLEAALPR